ncbi:MAG: type II toxin-antitoxin system PemK/MazF family toxin [Stellaceae bacterium]
MITAAENRSWDHDVPIPDHRAVGLPIPSIIRPAKITTVEARRARKLGEIPAPTAAEVAKAIGSIIGWACGEPPGLPCSGSTGLPAAN